MIRLHDLSFSYGDEPVLRAVNLEVNAGELVGFIGPSGAGKTTLLRILLGEVSPTSGRIEYTTAKSVAIGYVPQLEASERNFPLTVEEMVLLGAAGYSSRRPWFSRGEQREALAVLEQMGILHLRGQRLNQLSGGQFQRALIARALMSKPNLLLLDEPTSGIDLRTRQQILDIVGELTNDGYTVMLTTHDLNWVAAHLPRIVCLNRTIVADGAPSEVLSSEVVRTTYGAEMEIIFHNGRPVVVDTLVGGSGS